MCNKIARLDHAHDQCCTSNFRKPFETDPNNVTTTEIEEDILALSTLYIKLIFKVIRNFCDRVRNSKAYSILTRTTQPAHVAVMLAALFIAVSFNANSKTKSDNLMYKFIYAAATAAHFGSQIWMTFASGLSLYFSLPRHHFGEVQKVLFPLYFTLTSILSLATLLTHLKLTRSDVTTIVLALCFFTEFIVRLYLCGPLVRLICVKNAMEARHGLGMEVGTLSRQSSLFESQEYVSIHKRFRRLHMFIAFSNIACIGLSTAHLYFAVSELNFSS